LQSDPAGFNMMYIGWPNGLIVAIANLLN
jgi:hypothetical protein